MTILLSLINQSVDRYIMDGHASPSGRHGLTRACVAGGLRVAGLDYDGISEYLDGGQAAVRRAIAQWEALSSEKSPLVAHVRKWSKAYSKGKRGEGCITIEIDGSTMRFREPLRADQRRHLGFVTTIEDEERAYRVMNAAVSYMRKFGVGDQPRMEGEYYTPGTMTEAMERWLPQESAALYCGSHVNAIVNAAREGVIRRRPYAHTAGRVLYEYPVSDLDKYIEDKAKNLCK